MTAMKETEYYKSGKHKANVMAAREIALAASQRMKRDRIDLYNETPSLCEFCQTPLPYKDKHKRFCDRSCSAKFNNERRYATGGKMSEAGKQRIREKIKAAYESLTDEEKKVKMKRLRETAPYREKHADVEIVCRVCTAVRVVPFTRRRMTTCGGDDCKVQASVGERTYQNGSRKPVWFFNPYENKQVLLESSWEVTVAEYLIAKQIEWVRPKFVKWVDGAGKTRRYFPDFFLPTYELYLDPKNPYCMERDKEKIDKVSKIINLSVGSLTNIIDTIDNLT